MEYVTFSDETHVGWAETRSDEDTRRSQDPMSLFSTARTPGQAQNIVPILPDALATMIYATTTAYLRCVTRHEMLVLLRLVYS